MAAHLTMVSRDGFSLTEALDLAKRIGRGELILVEPMDDEEGDVTVRERDTIVAALRAFA
jgi:hypothetical protein